MKCQVTDDSPLIEFPSTGVRNMGQPEAATPEADDNKYGILPDNVRYGTVPAFREITFIAQSVAKSGGEIGQPPIFYIDQREEHTSKNDGDSGTASNGNSNSSYGFTVRPVKD